MSEGSQDDQSVVKQGFRGAQRYVANGYDAARRFASNGYETAKQYANKGYEASSGYLKTGIDFTTRTGKNVNELARKHPVIAQAAVFAVGYTAMYLVRRVSTPATPPKRGWRLVRRR